MRLDNYLVENNLVESRNKAQNVIKQGEVRVGGNIVLKPSFKVNDEEVELLSEKIYVSRAAHKLSGFLPLLPFKVEGLSALDIGSSTGGFCEVLLENDIKSIVAVDVGNGQLHESIKNDERVRSVENTDIREYKNEETFDLITSDVSFISLLHILDDVERLSSKYIILLFKPQFEVGREAKRDKNGVVKDEKAIAKAQMEFEDNVSIRGWKLIKMSESKLHGKEGNIEYCYCYEKN